MSRTKRMELLAPAGSYETLRAVIEAGADAVYLGGPAFGARAYANNFTEEELLEAIDYAHMRDCRVYLTVNTLLKNREIGNVRSYLEPYVRQGLDAVLVQDFGVLTLIREAFPDLAIHTSTQMTVTGPDGVRFLQKYGVSRVVMAREVSLKEMKRIHEETGMELEAFVHGAICYCYSGQCLFSSMLGGRSGNRGRCAQPCRLPYEAVDAGKQERGKKGGENYVISLKDMCGIEDLRALEEAGVYSLKIEGRMKSADYAAGVVSIYRKYLDELFRRTEQESRSEAKNRKLSVSKTDQEHLADLGSRCGFTDRYYYNQNGKDMITFRQPNFAYGNPEYHARIIENYVKNQQKLPIEGRITLRKGEPSLFEVRNPQGICACASGMIPMEAVKKPLTEEDVRKRMGKTGDTPFAFSHLDVTLQDECFLPNGSLNQLRREALDQLAANIQAQFHRDMNAAAGQPETPTADEGKQGPVTAPAVRQQGIRLLAETAEQLNLLFAWKPADRIYADLHIYTGNGSQKPQASLQEDLQRAHDHHKELFLALPQILRSRGEKALVRFMESPDFCQPDGYLVRNYEELYLIRRRFPEARFVTDHNMYTYNDRSVDAFLQAGAELVTMPLELNAGEIAERENDRTEMIVYGYYPLMVSAQCIHANTDKCDTNPQIVRIKDRYHALFPVKNNCRECYNVIYNSVPVCLSPYMERLKKAGISDFRLQFTIENAAETQKVLTFFEHVLEGRFSQEEQSSLGTVTYGHYKRGVE